ncbi:MAG: proline dehydrogenase family protein [Vulcanimicrobiaceae bacterium]
MTVIERILAPEGPLQARCFFLARRFVAGESIDAALAAVGRLNDAGMRATLDFLGEDVRDLREAERTRDQYVALLDALARSGLESNVSLKLSAFGLLVELAACERLVEEVVERASSLADPFVRIDMEGSALTTATLELFERIFARRRNLGPVIQAALRRSPDDVARLIALGARVRLCKGAYREPRALAYPEPDEIRRAYLRLAESLLAEGTLPAIATHDERVIAAVKTFARERRIDSQRFEFQQLYGVRPDLQRALVREGYRVRVYVPYGTHWAAYFYRRVTERRANLLFALRSLLGR